MVRELEDLVMNIPAFYTKFHELERLIFDGRWLDIP